MKKIPGPQDATQGMFSGFICRRITGSRFEIKLVLLQVEYYTVKAPVIGRIASKLD